MEQISLKEKENQSLSELLHCAEKDQEDLVSTIVNSWKTIWGDYQDLSKDNAEVHHKLEYLTEDIAKAKQDMIELKTKQQVVTLIPYLVYK